MSETSRGEVDVESEQLLPCACDIQGPVYILAAKMGQQWHQWYIFYLCGTGRTLAADAMAHPHTPVQRAIRISLSVSTINGSTNACHGILRVLKPDSPLSKHNSDRLSAVRRFSAIVGRRRENLSRVRLELSCQERSVGQVDTGGAACSVSVRRGSFIKQRRVISATPSEGS